MITAYAAAAAAGHISPALARFLGWAVVVLVIVLIVGAFLRLLGFGK